MRCPECTTRNSVAAKACNDCGHKFKRKPVPLAVKATLGVSAAGFALWAVAMAVVPSFIDAGNSLTRTAKHVAAGPSSADDAVKMHHDLDLAVRKYLKEIGKEKTSLLARKLQAELHSTAYEVHAFDLPRGLRIVEVDNGLQACDYLVMQDQSTVKIFPVPGLEVFDGGRIISESGAPTLVLIGHTGQGVAHPQIKVLALLPGDIADESEKAVPDLKGEGKPSFARNNKDINLTLSLWSMGTAQGLFKNPPNVVARQDDEIIRLALDWKDGHYKPSPRIGSSPLSAVYAVAWSIKTPGSNPFDAYLGSNGVSFVKQFESKKPGVSPQFIVEQLSSSPAVTTSRHHHHRQVSASTASYLLNGANAAYKVDLVNDGGKWVFNTGKQLTDEEVKLAEGQSKSSDITATNAAPPTVTAGSAPPAKIVVKQVEEPGKTDKSTTNGNAKAGTVAGAAAGVAAAALSTAPGTRKAFSAATSQSQPQPASTVSSTAKITTVSAPVQTKTNAKSNSAATQKVAAAAPAAETKKSSESSRHSKHQVASAKTGVVEGAAIDALANQAESKARAWLNANPDGGSTAASKPAVSAPVPGKTETTSTHTSKVSAATPSPVTSSSKPSTTSVSKSPTATTASSGTALKPSNVGQTVQITSDQVKLRRGPATEYRQVGEIAKGSKVEVIGKKNGWYQVRANGKEGFVYGALVDAKSDAYTTATVKLASTDGDTKSAAKTGDKVVVLGGIKDGKYKVQLANGKVASVPKEAIDVKVDAPDFVP